MALFSEQKMCWPPPKTRIRRKLLLFSGFYPFFSWVWFYYYNCASTTAVSSRSRFQNVSGLSALNVFITCLHSNVNLKPATLKWSHNLYYLYFFVLSFTDIHHGFSRNEECKKNTGETWLGRRYYFLWKLYHGSALFHTKFLQYCLRQWTGFE
jgi:hypothetical protein